MLYHVPNMDNFFKEVKKVMKPNCKILITTKSIRTLSKIEEIFLEIVDEMGISGINGERDERVFCRGNSESIMRKYFDERRYKLDTYDIATQLIVEDVDDLFTYIFSTMRYNLEDNLSTSEYKKYQLLWRDKISKYKVFLDEVIECILVVTEEQE